MRIAVFASGNGSNFEAVARQRYRRAQIVLLITDNENAYCVERSKKLNIPYYIFPYDKYSGKSEYEKDILLLLTKEKIDVIVLAGYMRIVSPIILNAYPKRILNIHPSLLPAFKGMNAIREAYNYGVKIIGITVHYVSPAVDAGEIIAQDAFRIGRRTLPEVEARIHRLEHRLYPRVIKRLFDKQGDRL
ncbi:MAG: phosphoribosylglycinamide formyltransferase [Bacilli bacterium]|nr:phosphoribosylglycinamide formyltransferase [Bacilli bacterium]MDD4076712.1 phosphoribosylglycinamide formyltransferase [Bacilli bacterium]MDD4388338.1 phosphoribosylglycinamide formyltransferase [Bacilli bacterium]